MPKMSLAPTNLENPDALKAVVEWETTPKSEREHSLTDLANILDISRRAIYHWRDQEWYQKMVRYEVFKDLSTKRAQVYEALVEEAKGGSVPAIRHYSELLGDHVKQIDVTSGGESISKEDARTMTTEELARAMIDEKADSESFKKRMREAGVDEEELATLLMDLIDA